MKVANGQPAVTIIRSSVLIIEILQIRDVCPFAQIACVLVKYVSSKSRGKLYSIRVIVGGFNHHYIEYANTIPFEKHSLLGSPRNLQCRLVLRKWELYTYYVPIFRIRDDLAEP